VNLTSRSPEIPFVHSSHTIPPFGLTDALIEEERADRPALFLDRPLEFFRLLPPRRTRAGPRAYQRRVTISSMAQTWSAIPASIAGSHGASDAAEHSCSA
jgi:hypothetical protein